MSETQLGEWLRGSGPDVEISMCTRVRLARNVQGYRFAPTMSPEEAEELQQFIGDQLTRPELGFDLRTVALESVEPIERQVLIA